MWRFAADQTKNQVLDKYLKTDAEPNEINCHLNSSHRIIKLLTKPLIVMEKKQNIVI